jgi:predicted lysophospholipase L1 biosynthesis ABC-type transport system permease subunit
VARYDWFPMIRGRLIAINGQEVGPTTCPTAGPGAWSTASST